MEFLCDFQVVISKRNNINLKKIQYSPLGEIDKQLNNKKINY